MCGGVNARKHNKPSAMRLNKCQFDKGKKDRTGATYAERSDRGMIARTCPHLSEHLLAINLAGFARHEMIAHPPRLLHSTS